MSNNYVLKAMDAYPFDLEETVENLNYALAYEESNVYALYLLGRLQAEQFCDYEAAKKCFEEALANKLDYLKVYGFYIQVLVANEDYSEAQKLIDFAMNLKGLNKAEIWFYQGRLLEKLQKNKKALKAFNKSKLLACDENLIRFLNSELRRVKHKIKSAKKLEKRKKKKKRKRK